MMGNKVLRALDLLAFWIKIFFGKFGIVGISVKEKFEMAY
jgi:hypothetical protein